MPSYSNIIETYGEFLERSKQMMTEYQRLYYRERSRFRKKLRLCDHCGREPARENRVLGVECQKRQADNYRRKVQQ